MNKFELYCMIYYVLDAEWDENKNEELGKFLSSANPFQFKDIGSADPLIYKCAIKYVNSLESKDVKTAFLTVDREEWDECLKEYLSQEHKGDKQ